MRSKTLVRLIFAFSPSPVRTAWATHSRLITGSMPGIAASTRLTWLFGSAPNSVEAPENSLALEVTWAWTSMPTITSQSPVCPSISLEVGALLTASFIARVLSLVLGPGIGRVAGPVKYASDEAATGQHDLGDPVPLVGMAALAHRLARLAVPVAALPWSPSIR